MPSGGSLRSLFCIELLCAIRYDHGSMRVLTSSESLFLSILLADLQNRPDQRQMLSWWRILGGRGHFGILFVRESRQRAVHPYLLSHAFGRRDE